jgi:hypothetical protein
MVSSDDDEDKTEAESDELEEMNVDEFSVFLFLQNIVIFNT